MHVTVFADDLSGANTTAALFHKRGWAATVHLGRPVGNSDWQTNLSRGNKEVHVWNSGTRNQSGFEAARIFEDMMRDYETGNAETNILAFRIDSTLRGPIAPSMDTLLDACPNHVAFVVPAYPDSGRTTKDGIQFVNGVPVHETPVGQDPFAPVHCSDLRECIGLSSRYPFVHVPLHRLHGDVDECLTFLEEAMDGGARVIIADAVTHNDIHLVAEMAVELTTRRENLRILPVDPGPFTVALTPLLAAEGAEILPLVLGISASIMHNAKAQMDYLEHTLGLPMIHYTGQSVSDVIREMKTLVEKFKHKRAGFPLLPGSTLFLRTDTWKLDDSTSSTVIQALPEILTAAVMEIPSLRGFYLSGGEAAATVLAGVGVTTLAMEMEVAPLTTMSRPQDGLLAGKYVVTKGGAIGTQTAVLEAIIKLHEVIGLSTIGRGKVPRQQE